MRPYFKKNCNNGILLASMPKSGTHLVLNFLCNYIHVLNGADSKLRLADIYNADRTINENTFMNSKNIPFERILSLHFILHGIRHHKSMVYVLLHILGVDKELFPKFTIKVINQMSKLGVVLRLMLFYLPKAVFLCRNPLDWCVSNYYFQYNSRNVLVGKHYMNVSSYVMESNAINVFISGYKIFKKYKHKENVLPFFYEDLIKDKVGCFKKMIAFLGLPIDEEKIIKAIQYSSKEEVRKEEIEHGRVLVVSSESAKVVDKNNPEISFVRDGRIGQWKKRLSKEAIEHIKTRLAKHNISLNEFILE